MILLILVTLLWAFSFSLIGEYLSGHVDSYFSVLMRTGLAMLVFLPFIRVRNISWKLAAKLLGIGAVQVGLMYVFYFNAFQLISVPEVLVFTIFTPVYVTFLYDLLNGRFTPWYFLTAILAVLGAAIIRYQSPGENVFGGFLLIQCSNACFAFGQVAYKKILTREVQSLSQVSLFGYFYAGAFLVALAAWLTIGSPQYPAQPHQWAILIWLGVGASGLGYFLWNMGAVQVNAGFLSIMNNALIPAGLLVNLILWNQETNLLRLATGGSIILLSLAVNQKIARS